MFITKRCCCANGTATSFFMGVNYISNLKIQQQECNFHNCISNKKTEYAIFESLLFCRLHLFKHVVFFLLKFLQNASNVNKNVDILIYVTVRGLSNFAIE